MNTISWILLMIIACFVSFVSGGVVAVKYGEDQKKEKAISTDRFARSSAGKHNIHSHPGMEKRLGVPEGHCIVDSELLMDRRREGSEDSCAGYKIFRREK